MKIVRTLFTIAVLMVLISTVCLAEVNVGIDLNSKWNFQKKGESDSRDEGSIKIKFDADLQENITSHIVLKTNLGNYKGGGTNSYSKSNIYLDEYYIKYKTRYGNFKLGRWGYKPKEEVDVIDWAFGNFKTEWGLRHTYEFQNGFHTGLWLALDKSVLDEVVGNGAYVATLGWSNDKLAMDVNAVDTGNIDDILVMKRADGRLNKKADELNKFGTTTQMGYTANLVFKISDYLKTYTHYSKNDIKGEYNDDRWIVGTRIDYGPWDLNLEYGLDDEYVDGTRVYKDADHGYGFKVKYTFPSKINIDYKYYRKGYGHNQKSELGLSFPIR